MHFWTENPLEEIWNQLRSLSSTVNVRRILSRKSGERPDDESVYHIASLARQADEFFHAARSVTMNTRPLLHFYGVQALAKIIIISEMNDVPPFKYHGLTTDGASATSDERKDWLRLYRSDPNAWSLESEFVVTNGGVFQLLSKVVDSAHTQERGAVLVLQDLLAACVDIAPQYQQYYGAPSRSIPLVHTPETTADETFRARGISRAELLQVFPELGDPSVATFDSEVEPVFRPVAGLDAFSATVPSLLSRSYLVRRLEGGVGHPLLILYAIAYILSDLVRYRSRFWISLLEGHRTGSIALIEAVSRVIERRFAHETLEIVMGQKMSFGGPMYWG